jgi:hypothetical protein
VLQCGDVEKLIKKKDEQNTNDGVKYFAHTDKIFDIVKRAHTSTGHGGRDKMLKALTKYANVTRDVVELYKSFCSECLQKRKRPRVKGVVVKPILTGDYGSRGQVDLIDMQSLPSDQKKWIMVYQVYII